MTPMKPEIDDTMSLFTGYDPAKERAVMQEKKDKQDEKNEVNKKLYNEVNEILLNKVYFKDFKNEPNESYVSEPNQLIKKTRIVTQEIYENKLLRSKAFCSEELKKYREKNANIKPTVEPKLLALNLTEIMATAQEKIKTMTQEQLDKKNKENWEIFKEVMEIEKMKKIPYIKRTKEYPLEFCKVEILEKEYERAKFYESFFTRDGYQPNKCVGCSKYYTPISPLGNPFSIKSEASPEPMIEQAAESQQVSCTKCGSTSYFKYGKRIKKAKGGGVVSIQKYQCSKCASFFNYELDSKIKPVRASPVSK